MGRKFVLGWLAQSLCHRAVAALSVDLMVGPGAIEHLFCMRRHNREADELRVRVLLRGASLEAVVLEDHGKRHIARVVQLAVASRPQQEHSVDLGEAHAAAEGSVMPRRLQEEFVGACALPRLEEATSKRRVRLLARAERGQQPAEIATRNGYAEPLRPGRVEGCLV